jgi:ketosteroid isomerase-like protein
MPELAPAARSAEVPPPRFGRRVRKLLYALIACVVLSVVLVRSFGLWSARSAAARTPEQTVDAFYEALHQGNAALALSLLGPDALVFEMGKVDRSRREYAAVHLPADMAIAARGQRELLSRHSTSAGDLYWVMSTYRETLPASADAPGWQATLAETVALRSAGGAWQIEHLHWSADPSLPPKP